MFAADSTYSSAIRCYRSTHSGHPVPSVLDGRWVAQTEVGPKIAHQKRRAFRIGEMAPMVGLASVDPAGQRRRRTAEGPVVILAEVGWVEGLGARAPFL
jgi:hypothetical protein